jgi:hypothetical protein
MELRQEAHAWTFDEIGERWILKFHAEVFTKSGVHDFTDQITAIGMSQRYREALRRSDVMYVSGDMQQIIQSAAEDIPEDLEFHDHNLLCNSGFVLLNDGVVGEDVQGTGVVMKGMMWHKTIMNVITADGEYLTPIMALWLLTDTWDERDAFTQFLKQDEIASKLRELNAKPAPRLLPGHLLLIPFDVPYLAQWPSEPGSKLTEMLARMFIAINLVAQQNISETARIQTPRATRRRWNLDNNSVITLITLRRKKMKLPDDHEPAKIEWSRRWIVRGFWRNQWFPKTKTHDWVYIHEYVKGPEDKPLVITERRVFDFRR